MQVSSSCTTIRSVLLGRGFWLPQKGCYLLYVSLGLPDAPFFTSGTEVLLPYLKAVSNRAGVTEFSWLSVRSFLPNSLLKYHWSIVWQICVAIKALNCYYYTGLWEYIDRLKSPYFLFCLLHAAPVYISGLLPSPLGQIHLLVWLFGKKKTIVVALASTLSGEKGWEE